MGKYVKTKIGHNSTQIKDGWVVKVRKDGTITKRVEPYPRPKDK
jgi:hypothetical protein